MTSDDRCNFSEMYGISIRANVESIVRTDIIFDAKFLNFVRE